MKTKRLALILTMGCCTTPSFFTPVLADEQTVQQSQPVSMIDSVTNQVKRTKTYRKKNKSLVNDSVKQVEQTKSAMVAAEKQKQAEEQKAKQEDETLSQLGFKTKEDKLVTNDQPVCPNPLNGETKSYMDGAKVTNTASKQYQLLQTMHINDQGFYATDDGFIGVALGSYYGPIGSKFTVTLSNGNTFKVIKADEKSDNDVYNGCYHKQDGSMMEFVIDTETAGEYWGMINGYVLGGNFNNCEQFNGTIVSMERVFDNTQTQQ